MPPTQARQPASVRGSHQSGSFNSRSENPKSEANVEHLLISTSEQAKRGKRKEIIKSLKFLRTVGSKLRNETKTELEKLTRYQSSKNVLSMPPTLGIGCSETQRSGPGKAGYKLRRRTNSLIPKKSNDL